MNKPYQWRGSVPLKADDHEFWRLVQKRIGQNWSWDQIALEIGCNVDDLLHWANWVYQPPKQAKLVTQAEIARSASREPRTRFDRPDNTLSSRAAHFAAWRKSTAGARAALEAMGK